MIGGHVATSVGGALPGKGVAAGIVAQHLVLMAGSGSTVVPDGAFWVFAEAIGAGGTRLTNGSIGGGAAGSDAIFAVVAGATISYAVPSSPVGGNATITYSGTVQVTAASGNQSDTGARGTVGKYLGQVGGDYAGGKGGGRLAGNSGYSGTPQGAGPGGGGFGNNTNSTKGGPGICCLTYFASYDVALAFAKSLYGGTWS